MSKEPTGLVAMPLVMEELEACKYSGFPITKYYSLPGIRYWIEPDTEVPLSKSDIIAFYRMSKMKSSIENDLGVKEVKYK